MVAIFISYAHADMDRLNAFLTHFQAARMEGVEVFHDRSFLKGGDIFDERIQKQMRQSDIFICMVSSNYLNSNYIMNTELPIALQAVSGRSALLVPIIVENTHWEAEFRRFHCLPHTKKGKLLPAADWKPMRNGFFESSKQAKAAIEAWLHKMPPEPENPGKGPSVILTKDGFELADDPPSMVERSDPLQNGLHDVLKSALNRLLPGLQKSCGNSHPVLMQELGLYAEFAQTDLGDLNVAALVAAGSALEGMVQRLKPPLPAGVMTEPLEPEALASLESLLNSHARLIMGFAEAREMVARLAEYTAHIEDKLRAVAETRAVLTPMADTQSLLAPQAKRLIDSVNAGLVELGRSSEYALGEAIRTGGRVLAGIARAVGRHVKSPADAATLIGFGSILAGDPNFEVLRAAISFLSGSAASIGAFASNQPELRRVLGWALEQVKSKNRAAVVEGHVVGGSSTEGPPADFDLTKIHEMIVAGQALPQNWVPWVTILDFHEYPELSDISMISKLSSLFSLNISNTRVSDLSSLSTLKSLNILILDSTSIRDLFPISNLFDMRVLSFKDTIVADLSPISKLTALKFLYCTRTEVATLAPISGLLSLEVIYCSDNNISDISPLSHLTQIKEISCYRTQISDLSPLFRLKSLVKLTCFLTKISDLSPLSDLTSLEILDCAYTTISDLSCLGNLKLLKEIDFSSTKVDDISPLSRIDSLIYISCNETPIKKITDLPSNLKGLFINHMGPVYLEIDLPESLEEIDMSGTIFPSNLNISKVKYRIDTYGNVFQPDENASVIFTESVVRAGARKNALVNQETTKIVKPH